MYIAHVIFMFMITVITLGGGHNPFDSTPVKNRITSHPIILSYLTSWINDTIISNNPNIPNIPNNPNNLSFNSPRSQQSCSSSGPYWDNSNNPNSLSDLMVTASFRSLTYDDNHDVNMHMGYEDMSL